MLRYGLSFRCKRIQKEEINKQETMKGPGLTMQLILDSEILIIVHSKRHREYSMGFIQESTSKTLRDPSLFYRLDRKGPLLKYPVHINVSVTIICYNFCRYISFIATADDADNGRWSIFQNLVCQEDIYKRDIAAYLRFNKTRRGPKAWCAIQNYKLYWLRNGCSIRRIKHIRSCFYRKTITSHPYWDYSLFIWSIRYPYRVWLGSP